MALVIAGRIVPMNPSEPSAEFPGTPAPALARSLILSALCIVVQ